MGTRTQQMHEFLSGYLGPSSGPPTFGVPSQPLNARLPVSPGDAIPGGIRPIPTSSQSNKKTNAQIPYVRLVFSETGTAGLRSAPKEGDIVLVERTTINDVRCNGRKVSVHTRSTHFNGLRSGTR